MNMAFFRKLILLLQYQYLPTGFLFGLVVASIMVTAVFFFAWPLMAYVNDAVEDNKMKKCGVEFHRQMKKCGVDNKTKSPHNLQSPHFLQYRTIDQLKEKISSFEEHSGKYIHEEKRASLLSAVDIFRRQSALLKKNGGKYAPMVMLEKTHLTLSSTVDKFKSQSNHFLKNGQENIPMVLLEKKHVSPSSTVDQYKGKYSHLEEDSGKNVHRRKYDSLLRIKKPKLKKERKKNSRYEVKVLEVKQKRKCCLGTSCGIELEGYLRSKRSKVDKEVNYNTSYSRNSEEKCKGRVEAEPDYMEVEHDYMEVELDYMEVEQDYMEVEPLKHSDMLIDSVTRIMNSLSLVEQSECKNSHSNMSIDDITTLMMDFNSVEQLNQTNLRMDMSVDDITNLLTGLSLIEHSDHIIDMCIEDVTNLMKVLSLTSIRRECFCIET